MKIERLDHVNIRTADMQASVDFYQKTLGFTPRYSHTQLSAETSQWLYDHNQHPIIHLYLDPDHPPSSQWPIDLYQTDAGEPVANTTGAVHHFALHCTGFQTTRDHLDACGVKYRVNIVEDMGMSQIFLRDPHGIVVELTFRDLA